MGEMGGVVVNGERAMAVLTGEGGWTVKKRGGESVLESALRLVGERSEVVLSGESEAALSNEGKGKARKSGGKKQKKHKGGRRDRVSHG
jgi:hypothetical protein